MLKKKPLLTLAGFLILLDGFFTLFGQDASYWQNFEQVNEMNPLAEYFLKIHPLLFVALYLIYFLLCLPLIYFFKRPLDLIFTMILFLWHAWGSFSWIRLLLVRNLEDYALHSITIWSAILIFYSLMGIFAALMINRAYSQQQK